MSQINDNAYRRIEADIQETTPKQVEIVREEVNGETDVEICIGYYQHLQRAIRRKQRIISLSYAYLIGRILMEELSKVERRTVKQTISRHYSRTSERIYEIFASLGLDQIYRSKEITIADFLRITPEEVKQLSDIAQEEADDRLFNQMWDEHHNDNNNLNENYDSGNEFDDYLYNFDD